jgi:two-component system sensor histidine kinase PhoQ
MRPVSRASIHLRLLVAASLVLGAFLGLTGLALDKAFRSSAEQALKDRLLAGIYAILAGAEEDAQGRFRLPELLTDPRFNMPDSGLYAEVAGSQAGFHWRSGSSVGRSLQLLQPVEPGEFHYRTVDSDSLGELTTLSYGVVWEDFGGSELAYVLAVAESLGPHREQIDAFRDTLLRWLGGAALLLLLAQGWVLRWGLRPLRSVADELTEIESGKSDQLAGAYPRELNRLTHSINSLIRHSQARQQRYRDSLGDLAHSLKTPLAILQGLADGRAENLEQQPQLLSEQVNRMNQIVSHQLQRAAAAGRTNLSKRLPIKAAVERIARSLDKVYRDKGVAWELELNGEPGFPGDEGDLMELLGNLMDNAWKYGNSRVRISGHEDAQHLELHVEDDGPGIASEKVGLVLQRGRRMDEQQPGQGIGLAVADDIISAYGGELKIGVSELGGADIRLLIPNTALVSATEAI